MREKIKYHTWIILFFIVVLGTFLRCSSFKEHKISNWNWRDVPALLNIATHLDRGLYNYDKRSLFAYMNKEDFLNYPFHRSEKLLSKYGKEEIDTQYLFNDPGLSFIYWAAFKVFGDNKPLTSVWKFALLADMLSIVLVFLACRMVFENTESLMASFLYAFNPFMYSFFTLKPALRFDIQHPYYYYWAGFFALVSINFWIYMFKHRDMSKSKGYYLFAVYGLWVGFFSMVRMPVKLIIPFVGIFYFLSAEKKQKRHTAYALLLGVGIQVSMLGSLVMYNKAKIGSYTSSPRYVWSQVIIGIGFYENPYVRGFYDDVVLEIAEEKYNIKRLKLINANMKQLEAREGAMRKEVFSIFEKTPELFLKNAVRNLYYAFFLAPRDWGWGARGSFNENKLPSSTYSAIYFILLCISGVYCFLFERERFYLTLLLLLVASYFLLTVCLVMPPYSFYISAYYPIFYILLSAGIMNTIRAVKKLAGQDKKRLPS